MRRVTLTNSTQANLENNLILNQSLNEVTDLLNFSLDNKLHISSVLTESGMGIVNEYRVLIEATNEVIEAEEAVSDVQHEKDGSKKVKLIERCINKLKDLINWWYKIEPDKKYPTLHLVLRIIVEIMIIVGPIILLKVPPVHAAYDRAGIAIMRLFGSPSKFTAFLSKVILGAFIGSIITIFKTVVDDIPYININKKDLDKNIKQTDRTIDELNELIDKTEDPEVALQLKKSKSNAEFALQQMVSLKKTLLKKEVNKNK